ncbi:AfsR/SARP family transcriptional regulator [Actinoplanes sichuanensis]|uniref:BTAD domain-containing putative transcriptional regulator n=1 Tax=Actinoplanes sichuanensis TaxID=512349 RepID=A0ABW4API5_9ACTN|nr:winged helix-turn-helix domain-containing protein [Actinoplanes sichuanensis]
MNDGTSAVALRFEMLGPIRAFRGTEPVDLGPPKQQAVLALLLLHAPRPVPLDQIVAALWNGDPPSNGVDVVQRFIGALRRGLDPERTSLITLTDGGYVIRAGENAVDTGMFRAALARARAEHQTGAIGSATDEIRTALGMWQDEPLTGLSGPVFESARARLNSERAAASALLAEPTAVAPTSPATPPPPAATPAPNRAPLAATRPFSPAAPAASPLPATRPFSPASASPAATRPFSPPTPPTTPPPEPAASPLPATRPFSPAEPAASPLPATRPFSAASTPPSAAAVRPTSPAAAPPAAATRPFSPPTRPSSHPPSSHPPSSQPPSSSSAAPERTTTPKPPPAKAEPEKNAYPEAVDPWEGHDLFPPDPLSMS